MLAKSNLASITSKSDLTLWKEIKQHLYQKYNVLGALNLHLGCIHPALYYNYLKLLSKNRYETNDRILFFHYDTDFYLESIGFTLYNFFGCLKELDISLDFCIFLTNHYGIKPEIDKICKIHGINSKPLSIIECNYSYIQATPLATDTPINIDHITFPFICLQRARRSHRVFLSCVLKEFDVLEKGIVSWHFDLAHKLESIADGEKDIYNYVDPGNHLTFLQTNPFTQINDSRVFNTELKNIYSKHAHYFESSFKHPEIELAPHRWETRPFKDGTPEAFNLLHFLDAIKKAFLYVSVETAFDYPYPYLSEKTFKAILHKRPFVIVGAPNSIKQLKNLGFKTFDQYWDESYDQILDPSRRLLSVAQIIKDISSKDLNILKDMCYSMKEILDYNLMHYIENFSKRDLYKLIETI